MFISFSFKLLNYISIVASLFLGLKVDFGLSLFWSNPSFSLFRKCHFKRTILPYVYIRRTVPYASSSALSFALLIWLLVGTNFNSMDNNRLFNFRLSKFPLRHKLTFNTYPRTTPFGCFTEYFRFSHFLATP